MDVSGTRKPGTNKRSRKKDNPEQLGHAVRRRRKAMGMTMVQVAEETELTPGFISQVERGISTPSLSSLLSIAASLQTTVEQLLSVDEEFREYIHKDNRHTYALGVNGRLYEKLGPGFSGALCYPSIIHRPPGHVSEKMCHEGEVFCYLISGQLEYHLGDAVHIMSPGDTVHHDCSKPHYSIVLSDEEAVELWVSTMPMKSASH
ncbi:cupin domain-containing protein (plasmid) [Phaeobacter inhibens]|uniref:helix-turn-helix domain-containing protein n=1 Tax=Phaeobacter inhibens TaxID=221822 RepID=UPI000160EE20|nr:XRE family transcriptional regulator [Phaeobacter inhibens]AFO89456.1 putative transcriptional regulator [Phaeobacter inhibens 2.10]AXT44385.1 cupin domain-containing protein [Phaeobacter inhibens]